MVRSDGKSIVNANKIRMELDNIFNDDKIILNNTTIDQLTELIFKRILETYGPIYPLQFGIDNEEILVGELARLNTVLMMLESKEQYRKCAIVKNRIRNIEATLNNKSNDKDESDAGPQI